MAKLKGLNGKLYDGSTQIPIENITLDEGMNLEEDSNMGDTAENYDATQSSGDISFDGFWEPAVGEHVALVTKMRAGTPISMTWILSGTKGSGTAIGVTGTFTMNKFTRKETKKGMLTFTASGKFSGILADATNL
jgi:hypothetical protein